MRLSRKIKRLIAAAVMAAGLAVGVGVTINAHADICDPVRDANGGAACGEDRPLELIEAP